MYWATGTEEWPAYDDELLRAWPDGTLGMKSWVVDAPKSSSA